LTAIEFSPCSSVLDPFSSGLPLADALYTAYQIASDVANTDWSTFATVSSSPAVASNNIAAERHVVLVSNTNATSRHSSIALACAEPRMVDCAGVIAMMRAANLHLSIVCPRQLGTMQALYSKVRWWYQSL
jgi:hypothetical protein